MKKSTQKNIYIAVAAGLGCVLGIPSVANAAPARATTPLLPITEADSLGGNSATGTNVSIVGGDDVNVRSIDDTIVSVDTNNLSVGRFIINDFNNNTAARNNVLTVDADDGISGNHQGTTNSTTWTYDENGLFSVHNNAPGGGTDSNTTTNNTTSSSNTITDSTDTTFRNQTATAQYDEASGGGNIASRNQTKIGQTDRAAVGGNSAERRQTATTQDDEIISGANSNRLASNVGNSTRTIVGAGGTTAVSQDDRDWIASTGAGAGSARVAVRNSGGAGNSTAELSVTNSAGNTHGVFVGENSTRISGGTNSTSLAFDDNGAHFRNDSTGGPARVTGVADGVADFDAVNFRQLNNLDKKLTGKINETGAVAAAFAQLGQAQTPGKSTFGIAAGGQGSKAGVALGFSHRPVTMKPVVIKASLGASGKTVAGGVGATWEF